MDGQLGTSGAKPQQVEFAPLGFRCTA